MSLREYKRKRHFTRTPEPRGKQGRAGGPLRFVVQKHHASRLHYDFRLELDGTLKSWAVPKGPSLDPADKRLAVMVEDHPLEYRTFEGTIPAGNYGAGTVQIWDEGTYQAAGTTDASSGAELLRNGLDKGRLSIVLNGKKLKGEFSLVRMRRGDGKNWLLVKKRDEWASQEDVTAVEAPATKGRQSVKGRSLVSRRVKPMLATLVDEPFDREGWLFEVKWDGYRAIAEVSQGSVALYSRNHNSFDRTFSAIAESLRTLPHEAVLDGELVVVDNQGRARFQLLQQYQKTGAGQLQYCVFDLLHLDGRDLRGLPLRERKKQLVAIVRGLPNVFLSEHVEKNGTDFFRAAVAAGLEGIIAKDGDSPYREGRRGLDWLKIKTKNRQEAVIGGFTEPRGSRKDLGALVLGVYDGPDLIYIGHTGGGFDTNGLRSLRQRLNPLVQRTCPFPTKPKVNAPVHWVTPKLVCEVRFQEWTDDGRMRQPIFVGMRADKPARTVHRETPRQVAADKAEHPRPPTTMPSAARSRKRNDSALVSKGDAKVVLTNLNKTYWPDEGYTKGDLIAYYRDMAAIMLPYLRDRPESLHRHPNGIKGKSFFQKDVSRQPPPPWVETIAIPSESTGENTTYLVCQNEDTLLYMANLGCVEINPWNSRVGTLDRPDYLVIDLDPENAPFAQVVEAAVAVRKILDRAGATSVCKTSGKTGLHVYVPLRARYETAQARQFAEIVANLVHQQLPSTTSVVRSPKLRQRRVYLDFLQNRIGQTLAAPYSVRPHPGATVSTPLKWNEVRKTLDPAKFTLKTLARRMDRVGDLWSPVLGPGIDLPECLARLSRQ